MDTDQKLEYMDRWLFDKAVDDSHRMAITMIIHSMAALMDENGGAGVGTAFKQQLVDQWKHSQQIGDVHASRCK